MHVTLRQLNVFEAVARNLSFTRAAEELHLSQPAVSMQVRQLEDSVGLELFEKFGKKIQLSEAGRELHHYSQFINQHFDFTRWQLGILHPFRAQVNLANHL